MDEPTQPGRESARSNRNAPRAPSQDDNALSNARYDSHGDERTSTDQSSSAKPALTERERRERWPVD